MSTKDILFGSHEDGNKVKTFNLNADSTTNFSIQQDNAGFVIRALTKSLYRDPIKGMVRELLSNAVDGVRNSGTKKIFFNIPNYEQKFNTWITPDNPMGRNNNYHESANAVSPKMRLLALIKKSIESSDKEEDTAVLEENLEQAYPYDPDYDFVIRDFGTGIEPEIFSDLYTSLFNSTKRNDKDAIGYFGLGSKSPFAVTDDFAVINYYNGMRYHYVAKLLDTGATLTLISEGETIEPNGLCVIVPNKNSRQYVYYPALVEFTKYFTDIDFIIGDEDSVMTKRLKNRLSQNKVPTIDQYVTVLPRHSDMINSLTYEDSLACCMGNVFYEPQTVMLTYNGNKVDLEMIMSVLKDTYVRDYMNTIEEANPLRQVVREIIVNPIRALNLSFSVDYLLQLPIVRNVVLPPSRDTVSIEFYEKGKDFDSFVREYLYPKFQELYSVIADAYMTAILNNDTSKVLALCKEYYPFQEVDLDILVPKNNVNINNFISWLLATRSSVIDEVSSSSRSHWDYGDKVPTNLNQTIRNFEALKSLQTDDCSELSDKLSFGWFTYLCDNQEHVILRIHKDGLVTIEPQLQYCSTPEDAMEENEKRGFTQENVKLISVTSAVLNNIKNDRHEELKLDKFELTDEIEYVLLFHGNVYPVGQNSQRLGFIEELGDSLFNKEKLIEEMNRVHTRSIEISDRAREINDKSPTNRTADEVNERRKLVLENDKLKEYFRTLSDILYDSDSRTKDALRHNKDIFGCLKHISSHIMHYQRAIELKAHEVYKLKRLETPEDEEGKTAIAYLPLQMEVLNNYGAELEFIRRQRLEPNQLSINNDPSYIYITEAEQVLGYDMWNVFYSLASPQNFLLGNRRLARISKGHEKQRMKSSFIGESRVTFHEFASKQMRHEHNMMVKKLINLVKFACSEEGYKLMAYKFVESMVYSMYRDIANRMKISLSLREYHSFHQAGLDKWALNKFKERGFPSMRNQDYAFLFEDSDVTWVSLKKSEVKDKRIDFLINVLPNFLISREDKLTTNSGVTNNRCETRARKPSKLYSEMLEESQNPEMRYPYLFVGINKILGACFYFNKSFKKVDLNHIVKHVALQLIELQYEASKETVFVSDNHRKSEIIGELAQKSFDNTMASLQGEIDKIKPDRINKLISSKVELLIPELKDN